jgi:hypothetical protein
VDFLSMRVRHSFRLHDFPSSCQVPLIFFFPSLLFYAKFQVVSTDELIQRPFGKFKAYIQPAKISDAHWHIDGRMFSKPPRCTFPEGKKHTGYRDYGRVFIPDPIVVKSFAELPGAAVASKARKRILESIGALPQPKTALAIDWDQIRARLERGERVVLDYEEGRGAFISSDSVIKAAQEQRAGAEAWNP